METDLQFLCAPAKSERYVNFLLVEELELEQEE
jgi:hypothetical protein